MSIFLLILKLIGIVLLVLLGLITLLVLLVLFCPFTYRIYGSSHEKKTNVHIRVFWLFYLLGFCMDTGESGMQLFFRIFGIRKTMEKSYKSGKSEDTIEQDLWEDTPVVKVMENEKKPGSGDENSDSETEKQKHSVWQKIQDEIHEIRSMFKNMKRTGKKVLALFNDEYCQTAFHTLWERLFAFLRSLKPKKMKLTLQYSTGSPDTTGELLGIIAMFPAAYQHGWNITPDFTADSFYAEVDFDFRGHLFGIQILSLAVHVILDKNCRRLYNRLKRMK